MRRTTFAGLTELDPAEPLSDDNFSFQSRNPDIIDHYLEVGARSHRHDAHPAVGTPGTPLTLAAVAAGGTLPGDVTMTVVYTCVDSDGGETLASPVADVTLPPTVPTPGSAPTTAVDHAAGTLGVGTYYYCMTWVDAGGGETLAGPQTSVDIVPGYANSEVVLGGLTTAMPAAATGWRLYKAIAGSDFRRMADGTSATFTDDGIVCSDAASRLPLANTTAHTNKVTVTLPVAGLIPSGSVSLRIYASISAGFPDPSYIETLPIASAGSSFDITTFTPAAGRPPNVATAIEGAALIDPDTEMLEFPWKRSVATASALPATGNGLGDMRVTRDDMHIHGWDGGTWEDVTALSATPEPWTQIASSPAGAENWYAALNDSAHAPGSFYRTPDGEVRFKGVMTAQLAYTYGGTDSVAAQMPLGYQPDVAGGQALEFSCWYFATTAATWSLVRVRVWDDGRIMVEADLTGSGGAQQPGFVDLSPISYRAKLPTPLRAIDVLGTSDHVA